MAAAVAAFGTGAGGPDSTGGTTESTSRLPSSLVFQASLHYCCEARSLVRASPSDDLVHVAASRTRIELSMQYAEYRACTGQMEHVAKSVKADT